MEQIIPNKKVFAIPEIEIIQFSFDSAILTEGVSMPDIPLDYDENDVVA